MKMNWLLIDDEPDFCKSFADYALEKFNIHVHFFHNHQKGFEALSLHPQNYNALVLDAKCLKTEDQEVESDDALGFAMELLADFEKKTNLSLPFVVNTGYDTFAPFFESMVNKRGGRIFSKLSPHPDELFNYLLLQINNIENIQIERRYADVFELFADGHLSENNTKNDLLDILKNIDCSGSTDIKKTLALIRNIEETMRKKIQTPKPEFVNNVLNFLNRAVNNYGSHPAKDSYQPSKYSLNAVIYALLELLIWFKNQSA